MSSEAKKFATYNDLFALPDHMVGEIIAGELIASPRPGPRHARASSVLGSKIMSPFDEGQGGPGGWWILDEPELHLGGDILVPDLAGWKKRSCQHFPWINPILKSRPIGFARSFLTARLAWTG